MFSCLRILYFLVTCKVSYKRLIHCHVLQVSTHGSSTNHIMIWKYPSMTRLATLSSHSSEVHYLAVSPDGKTIITGGGDETLHLWNVFSRAHSRMVSAQFFTWKKYFLMDHIYTYRNV
jgi:WD40 repeat protein